LVRLLFALAAYNVSIERAVKNPNAYTLVADVLFKFAGGETTKPFLDDYAAQHLQSIYTPNITSTASANNTNNTGSELPPMSEKALSIKGYIVEPDTVAYILKLWRSLTKLVLSNKGPVPALKHFLPTIVAWWNLSKGMVDVISRYLKHLQVPIHGASPFLVLIVRYILLFSVNGCITEKLLKYGRKLIDSGCTSYRLFKHDTSNRLALQDVIQPTRRNR